MSCGKPLVQGFHFSENEFYETYGVPEPPLLKVKTEDDVFSHLYDLSVNFEKKQRISNDSKDWFNKHCGIGLADRWLNIILN